MKIFTLPATLSLWAAAALAQPAGWQYHQEIKLNTTAAGANVPGNVAKYPVAVNLTAANFKFAQAQPGGSDLRFTGTGGAALPFEIESWDAAAQKAAVWVKTDVKGNDASQAVVMHWGNPSATSASDSKAVFSGEDGWLGVWHLSEDGNTAPGGYKDASPTGAHGTGINYAPGSAVDARIGRGTNNSYAKKTWVKIDSTKQAVFNPATAWTISIWNKITSFPSGGNYNTFFCKGDVSWTLQRFGTSNTFEPCNHVEPATGAAYHLCAHADGFKGQTGVWYHFTVIFQRDKSIEMFINGKSVNKITDNAKWSIGLHTVGIGQQSQGNRPSYWDGILDEARVVDGIKDQNWITLDYESQKEGSKFLEFGPVSTTAIRGKPAGYLIAGPARFYDLQGRLLDLRDGVLARPAAAPVFPLR